MTTTASSAILICESEQSFVGQADQWRPGNPFPLMQSPSLDRFLVFAGEAPRVELVPRSGAVLSTGADTSRATGRLLAAATGREHRHLPAEDVAEALREQDGPVAVVGLADDVARFGAQPTEVNPRAGLLVGRTPESLQCLIYRCLVPGSGVVDDSFVVTNPFHADDLSADAVEFSELDELRERRHSLVVMHLHGRECSASLPDGVICGRSLGDTGPVEIPLGKLDDSVRLPACLRGGGCYRTDLTPRQRIHAPELNGLVFFAQSCSAVSEGVGSYPVHVGFGGGLLEGTAVAVIGGAGSHMAEVGAEVDVERGLAEGQELGEIVAGMNSADGGHRGGLTSFALLGDPGMVVPTTRPKPAAAPREVDAEALELLRHLSEVVLPRCEQLGWLEVEGADQRLAAGRRVARRLAMDPADEEFAAGVAELADEVEDIQLALVAGVSERIRDEGPDFLGDGSTQFHQVSRVTQRCPSCGGDTARRMVLRHPIASSFVVISLQCGRCGDVHWSTADDENADEQLFLDGCVDFDATRDRLAELRRSLRNDGDRPVRGAVGFAFQAFDDTLPTWDGRKVRVPAGDSLDLVIPMERPLPSQANPGLHTGTLFAVVDGIYLSSVCMMRLS